MNPKQKDYFAEKAKDYDKEKARTENVSNIANLILKEVSYHQDMHILDFGSGTGLLLSKIAPYVGKITAVDISKAMNETLESKRDSIDCELEILEIDLAAKRLNRKFDGIISSMTMHHVKDIAKMFEKFYGLLEEKGSIALSDLDTEDGTFHKDDTGVFHFGFDREEFLIMAKKAGFRNLKTQTVGYVENLMGNMVSFY
jgi:cyclopropane fatty-acyl-phospholipid synthase-like methyltransferase